MKIVRPAPIRPAIEPAITQPIVRHSVATQFASSAVAGAI
jgi:hypothetical protein